MTAAPDTTDGEAALRRRLADIAATTTVDPEAMDKIRQRTAVTRPTRWRLATVAAAIVLVVGAVVLTQRDRGSQVKTDQDRTTTTTDRDPTTTTTTAPSAPLEPGAPPPVGIPGGATGGSAPAGSGVGTGTGGAQPAPTPASPDAGTDPATPATPAAPAPAVPSQPTAPDGLVPTVTLATADYELQATVRLDAANGVYYMNIWRTDGTYVTMWNWSERPGQNCLGGSGLDVAFDGTPAHAVDWGLVRADATEVRLVSTSQIMARAQLGPEVVPGLRAWIGEQPLGQLDHVEARDAGGNVLHVASASSAMDAWPDTC